MDVRIADGDIVTTSSGGYERIGGIDEAVQRVRIAVLTVKGSFIYDRGLGTDYRYLSADDALARERLELLIKESCADIDDIGIAVVSFDKDSLTAVLKVCFNNTEKTTEVDLSGIIQ